VKSSTRIGVRVLELRGASDAEVKIQAVTETIAMAKTSEIFMFLTCLAPSDAVLAG
jgi:hypothetical protein